MSNLISSYINYKNNILLNEGWSPKVHTTISIYNEENPPDVVISPCPNCAINQNKGEKCRCGSGLATEKCCRLKTKIGTKPGEANIACPVCGQHNKYNLNKKHKSIIYLYKLYKQIRLLKREIEGFNYIKTYRLIDMNNNNTIQVSDPSIKSLSDAVNFAQNQYKDSKFSVEYSKEYKHEFKDLDKNNRIEFIKNRKKNLEYIKNLKYKIIELYERIKSVCVFFNINYDSIANIIDKIEIDNTLFDDFDKFYEMIELYFVGSGVITRKYDLSLDNKIIIRFTFDSYALKRNFKGSNYDGVKIVKNVNNKIEKKFIRGKILNKNSIIDSNSQEYPPPVKIKTKDQVLTITFDEKEGYVREDCGIYFKEDNAWRWAGSSSEDYENNDSFVISDLKDNDETPSRIIINKFIPMLEKEFNIKRMPGVGFPPVNIMNKYDEINNILNFNGKDFSVIKENYDNYLNSISNRKNEDERKCVFTILETEELIRIKDVDNYILLFGSLNNSRKPMADTIKLKSNNKYINLRNLANYKVIVDNQYDNGLIDDAEHERMIGNYNTLAKELNSELQFIPLKNKKKILAIKDNKLVLSYGVISKFKVNEECILFNKKNNSIEIIKCKNISNITYENLLKCLYGNGPFVEDAKARKKYGYKSIVKKLSKIKEINELIAKSSNIDEINKLIEQKSKIGNENTLTKKLNNLKKDRSQKNNIAKGIGKDLFFVCDSNKLRGESLKEKCEFFDKIVSKTFQNEIEAFYSNDKGDKLKGMIIQNKSIFNSYGYWTISSILDSKGATEYNSYKLSDSVDNCLNCNGQGFIEQDVLTFFSDIHIDEYENKILIIKQRLYEIYRNLFDSKFDSFNDFMERFQSLLMSKVKDKDVKFEVKYNCSKCNGSGFNFVENKILDMRKSTDIYQFSKDSNIYKYMSEVRDKYIIYYFNKPENAQINKMHYDYDKINDIFSGLSRGEILIKNPPSIDDILYVMEQVNDESNYFRNLKDKLIQYADAELNSKLNTTEEDRRLKYDNVDFRIKIAKRRFAAKIIQLFYKSVNSYGYSEEINRSIRSTRINNIKYSSHIKNIINGLNRIYNEFKDFIVKTGIQLSNDNIKICTFMTVNLLVKRNLLYVNEFNLHKRFNLLNIYYYDDFELYIIDKLINGNASQEEVKVGERVFVSGTIRKSGITFENSKGSFQTEVNHRLSPSNRNFIVALFEDVNKKFYFTEIYKRFYGNSDKLYFFINNNIKDFIIKNNLIEHSNIEDFIRSLIKYVYSIKNIVKSKHENFNIKKINEILKNYSIVNNTEKYSLFITNNLNNFYNNINEDEQDVDILKMIEELCNDFLKNLNVENYLEFSKNVIVKIKSVIGDINNIYHLSLTNILEILTIIDKNILSENDKFSLAVEIANIIEKD